jgi:hypothetical protein
MSNPDLSGSRATCPPSDRRLRLIREIATHDFKEYAPHLVKRRMSNPDGILSLLRLRVNSCTASPRSNGWRDFAILLLRTLNVSLSETRKSAALPEFSSCSFDLYRKSILLLFLLTDGEYNAFWQSSNSRNLFAEYFWVFSNPVKAPLVDASFSYELKEFPSPHVCLQPSSTPSWRSFSTTKHPTVTLFLCTHALRSMPSRQSFSESSTELWSFRTHSRVLSSVHFYTHTRYPLGRAPIELLRGSVYNSVSAALP